MNESKSPNQRRISFVMRAVFLAIFVALVGLGVYEYILLTAPPPTVERLKIRSAKTASQLHFGVIGDYGKPGRGLEGVARGMAADNAAHPMDFVLSVGDVLYKNDEIQSIEVLLTTYFSPLLDQGVPFYNALGNHDVRSPDFEAIRSTPLLHMRGRNYYKLSDPKGLLDLFILDSNTLKDELQEDAQYRWLDKELENSHAIWKGVALHVPLYSSDVSHGSSPELIRQLAPRLVESGVDFVFAGHNHFYERVTPQDGVRYFIVGGSSRDSSKIIPKDEFNEVAYVRRSTFMVVDLNRDTFRFRVENAEGTMIDTGAWKKGKPNDLFDVQVSDEVTSATASGEHIPKLAVEEEED